MATPSPSFNVATLRQLKRIVLPFFTSEKRHKARGLLALLISFSLCVAWVNVLMSYALRDVMSALAERRGVEFTRQLWIYLGTFALAIPLAGFYRYAEERLALLWRQWMTHHLVKRYFFRRAYYHLRSSEEVDNPDQRIAEDVRNFTTMLLSLVLIIVNSLINLVAFFSVLWLISLTLVGVLFLYTLVGTVVAWLIGRRLVGLNYRQYEREATFRYSLIRVRDNAESIAFFRGEKREHRDLILRFRDVYDNMLHIITWNRNLHFFTTGYNYLAMALPVIVVAPLYLSGKVQFGVIPQAAGAFATVLAATSLIITQFERLSQFTAGLARISGLWNALSEDDPEESLDEQAEQIAVTEEGQRLILSDLDVQTPKGEKTLVRQLDLVVKRGESIVLMGESGAGKSSLLRTIAGLWSTGSGAIQRPPLNLLMFLPQKPYMVPGSLRDQLLYPGAEDPGEERLREVLEQVNLPMLFKRVEGDLDRDVDWGNVLSLGEQQRVSFARLLLRKPVIAFLDEATSALDEPNEERLYRILRDLRIAYLSVGHRSTLKLYHDRLLYLESNGRWKLEKIEAEEPSPEPQSARN
ncbi:MAG: ABC transporter ATP-binding protein/permease [Verrucomicrobiales bacterium]